MNVTLESLKAKHGGNAENVYREIARLGGFGEVGQRARPDQLAV